MRTKIIILVIVVILFILLLSAFSSYNGLVSLDENVKAAWAQVENQYQRRFDLIPNLVETVKGYASHERETLTAVTEARAKVGQAQTPKDMIQANDQLSSVLARLMVVVERYPDLKANVNFMGLQTELSSTENRIAVERRRYNEKIREYNTKIRSLPTRIYAGILGFSVRETFEAVPEAQQAPKVEFD